jgi:hypothetical protein
MPLMLWAELCELRPPPPPPPPPLAKASPLRDSEAAVMAKAATVAVRKDFMVISDPFEASDHRPPMTVTVETPWAAHGDGRHKTAASAECAFL